MMLYSYIISERLEPAVCTVCTVCWVTLWLQGSSNIKPCLITKCQPFLRFLLTLLVLILSQFNYFSVFLSWMKWLSLLCLKTSKVKPWQRVDQIDNIVVWVSWLKPLNTPPIVYLPDCSLSFSQQVNKMP